MFLANLVHLVHCFNLNIYKSIKYKKKQMHFQCTFLKISALFTKSVHCLQFSISAQTFQISALNLGYMHCLQYTLV